MATMVSASVGLSSSVPPKRPHASSISSNSSNSSSTSSTSASAEAKSILSCHQCGTLIRFKPYGADTRAILDLDGFRARMGLEKVIVGSSSVTPLSPHAAGDQLVSLDQPVIAELAWEHQSLGNDHSWSRAPRDVEAFQSCNRRAGGDRIDQILPSRTNGRQILWVSDWEVDRSVDNADADGWIYAPSFDAFPQSLSQPDSRISVESEDEQQALEQEQEQADSVKAVAALHEDSSDAPDAQQAQGQTEPASASETSQEIRTTKSSTSSTADSSVLRARRRRLVRKRQIDGSIGSWYHEYLDSSSLLLNKKAHSCHECELALVQNLELFQADLLQEQVQRHACLQSLDEEVDEMASSGALLQALEAEQQQLRQEIARLKREEATIERQRQQLWQLGESMETIVQGAVTECAFLEHLLGLSREERQSVGVFAVHASNMLRRLQRYNVFNDVFHIWHDGSFGTINGLRLGRLPTHPVEWVEINAALGQAALLLATVAERANFEFTRNKLMPRGSFSRVMNMHGKEYYLFSDGGMFRRRGFNQAMVLFLECVDDACKHAMRDEPSLKFPYKISRGKIGDHAISLGNDEHWTKALKFMLTHLKWLLAWVAKRFP